MAPDGVREDIRARVPRVWRTEPWRRMEPGKMDGAREDRRSQGRRPLGFPAYGGRSQRDGWSRGIGTEPGKTDGVEEDGH